MPIAMSNYANRQSPNQQAKIASMLNAAAQSQRPDQGQADALMGGMNFMGPAPPDQRPSSIGPYTGDRPSRRSYRDFSNIPPVPPDIRSAPPPIMDQSGRPDQFGGLRTYDNPPPMPSPMQGIGPAPEFEKRPYTGPGPTLAPPISQSLGRMQQAPPTIRDQGLRPDPFFGDEDMRGLVTNPTFEPDTKPVPEEPSTKPSAEPEANRRYKVVVDDVVDPPSTGRGDEYGRGMSQRQPGGAIRGITNLSPIHSGRGTPMDPANYMPDYAGRAWGRGESMGWPGSDRTSSLDRGDTDTRFYSGLTAEEDLLLREQGFIDKGGSRWIIDRNTGQVTQNRMPLGGMSVAGRNTASAAPSGQDFGSRGETMQEAVGRTDWGGMLPELEKQMMEEKYRRRGR